MVKALNKAFNVLSIAIFSCCSLAVSASALDIGFGPVGEGSLQPLDNFSLSAFIQNCQPFINSALPILLIVAGLKFGFRFLRKSLK